MYGARAIRFVSTGLHESQCFEGTEDRPVMTFNEWKILADKARADATPQKQQPMEVPVKARGDRDLFEDLLDAESTSSVTSVTFCTLLAEKLELAKMQDQFGMEGKWEVRWSS